MSARTGSWNGGWMGSGPAGGAAAASDVARIDGDGRGDRGHGDRDGLRPAEHEAVTDRALDEVEGRRRDDERHPDAQRQQSKRRKPGALVVQPQEQRVVPEVQPVGDPTDVADRREPRTHDRAPRGTVTTLSDDAPPSRGPRGGSRPCRATRDLPVTLSAITASTAGADEAGQPAPRRPRHRAPGPTRVPAPARERERRGERRAA